MGLTVNFVFMLSSASSACTAEGMLNAITQIKTVTISQRIVFIICSSYVSKRSRAPLRSSFSSNAVFSLVTFYGAATNAQVTLPVYAPFVICELGVVMFNFTFDNSESHVP